MDWSKLQSTLMRASTPAGVTEIQATNAYAKRHAIAGTFRAKRQAFALGRQYGLHLIPSVDLTRGLVIDVGANVGNFVEAVLRTAPSAQVIAVEPGDVQRELTARFASDRRVTIETRAIAAEAGTAVFHETSESVFSSLRAPDESLEQTYGAIASVKESTTVETITLDQLVDGRDIALLKIDVQGAERELIRGAQRSLASAKVVLLEVNFMTHYEGEADFAELHQLMADHGLALWQMGTPYRPDPEGRDLWTDACYVRADALAV